LDTSDGVLKLDDEHRRRREGAPSATDGRRVDAWSGRSLCAVSWWKGAGLL